MKKKKDGKRRVSDTYRRKFPCMQFWACTLIQIICVAGLFHLFLVLFFILLSRNFLHFLSLLRS